MNLDQFKIKESFYEGAVSFFKTLNVPLNLIDDKPLAPCDILSSSFNPDKECYSLMDDVYILGMVDDAAFNGSDSQSLETIKNRKKDYPGILIFGVTLSQRKEGLLPTRSQLAIITRAFNCEFKTTPVAVIFQYENYIAFANAERSAYLQTWREGEKTGKVSLLRDIDIENPHTGHLKLLKELKIPSTIGSFKLLYTHWQSVFDVNLLNKKFYKEISNWYFWAVTKVQFPNDINSDLDNMSYNSESMIRLLTRMIFIWFLKEKKLIPEDLFIEEKIEELIKGFREKKSCTYYRAILQNLFFGTLNQKIDERRFAKDNGYPDNRKEYGVKNIYRYRNEFNISEKEVIKLFSIVPFLNGGLFDCLDYTSTDGKVIYMDGFSRNSQKQAQVPDELFFSDDFSTDLSASFGDPQKKNEPVRGLFKILNSYKFTISENTPLEEDVALDPELLGKVFENLLASYNPETKTNARNRTGSFYTPREIVNYMVDESLISYLESNLDENLSTVDLHTLFSYNDIQPFDSEKDIDSIVRALDCCKIFDPACGSGAFPMGILHKIVHVLGKLDPENNYWRKLQVEKVQSQVGDAYSITDKEERRVRLEEIDRTFDQSVNDPDYARKLYLIENSIYGSDLQPIAAQISKLRFFISLIVDQKTGTDPNDNYGIRPLPNLETKFVTADSLTGLDDDIKGLLLDDELHLFEDELKEVRHNYFNTRTRKQKLDCQKKDKEIRDKMISKIEGMVANENVGRRQEISQLKEKLPYFQKSALTKTKNKIKKLESMLLDEAAGSKTAQLLSSWNPYDQNGVSPFFDPEWMYGLSSGFDIVIGNPPYIQLQKDRGRLAEIYKNHNFKTFSRSGDIYCMFYERGVELINSKGNLCYITSNKWMKAKYGENMRQFFQDNGQVQNLIDFGDAPLFENATTYTNILLYRKELQNARVIYDLSGRVVMGDAVENMLERIEPGIPDFSSKRFLINSPNDARLKQRIEERGIPLKNWDIAINYGIKTGFNDAFVIDTVTKEQLILEDLKCSKIIKPLLRGKDIKRYRTDWQELWLIDTHNGFTVQDDEYSPINVSDYPSIMAHLEKYDRKLEVRSDKGHTPYNLRSCAYHWDFEKEKILWGNLSTTPAFAYDITGSYINAPANMLTSINKDIKYLISFMNSSFFYYYFRDLAYSRNGGFYEYKKVFIEQVPIPPIPPEEQEPFDELLDYIQFSHKLRITDPSGSIEVAPWFEDIMDLLVAGVLFEKEMKDAGCYINDDLLAFLPELKGFSTNEEKIKNISQIYKELSYEPLFESSRMRYKLIDIIKPVFGNQKGNE